MHEDLIQRLQSGSGRDPDLGVAIAQAIGWYAPEGVDEDAWANENEMLATKERFIEANIQHDLFDGLRGPGLCLALVREKLPDTTTIAVHDPDKGEEFTIFQAKGKALIPIAVGHHPELTSAILIALLRALETTDG